MFHLEYAYGGLSQRSLTKISNRFLIKMLINRVLYDMIMTGEKNE